MAQDFLEVFFMFFQCKKGYKGVFSVEHEKESIIRVRIG